MNLTEKVMKKIAIIDQYKTLYGEKEIHEYLDRNKTYEGIEDYLENKMKEKNTQNEDSVVKNNRFDGE